MSSFLDVSVPSTVVWFRRDLRLRDNSALHAALQRGGAVIPVYLLEEEAGGARRMGAASRWWLHQSLAALGTSLSERGSRLILARGDPAQALRTIVREYGADAVYWNRGYEPEFISRDKPLKAALAESGLEAKSFNSSLLFEPHTIANKEGAPFQVFTPFWRYCLAQTVAAPIPPFLGRFPAPVRWGRSLQLGELALMPKILWYQGLEDTWEPGEASAQKRLKEFMAGPANRYDEQRNVPGNEGTSRLSPALHFGEIGPRQIWMAAAALSQESGVYPANRGVQTFLKEVGWREFAHHLLYYFPTTTDRPLREEFAAFPWADDPSGTKLRAWQRGLTGYPLVDAGMRQLWRTGWMHNRVRMITASFLVKDLRLPWTTGAAWFWDTLVDADLAANTLGWQWSAGCGADAAPYFRIFSPILQGEKFDPEGLYVRRWVPEIARLPKAFLHKPWMATAEDLNRAGVVLGETYPYPIVDHAEAREAALAALNTIRKKT